MRFKSYFMHDLCKDKICKVSLYLWPQLYITWLYQIADHNCRITWVYNKDIDQIKKGKYEVYIIIKEVLEEVKVSGRRLASSFFFVLLMCQVAPSGIQKGNYKIYINERNCFN